MPPVTESICWYAEFRDPPGRLAGVILRVAGTGVIVRRFPIEARGSGRPSTVDAAGCASSTDEVVLRAVGDMFSSTVATTPLAMVCAFNPVTTHVWEPLPPTQETDFPAAAAAGPVMAVTTVKSADE